VNAMQSVFETLRQNHCLQVSQSSRKLRPVQPPANSMTAPDTLQEHCCVVPGGATASTGPADTDIPIQLAVRDIACTASALGPGRELFSARIGSISRQAG
jgi:hypothetical protein